MPEGFQAPPESGLAQEYMKLQDDFIKWQQQLLQNQHVLHSRVAPIAAQPPAMNNGAYKEMMNQNSQSMSNPSSSADGAQRRPIEINIPIRFEGDDEVDNTRQEVQPPQSSRWNNAPNVQVNSWQNRPEPPPEKREFVLVTDPPQVFHAPNTPPDFRPMSQQRPKDRSPQPRQFSQPVEPGYHQQQQQQQQQQPSQQVYQHQHPSQQMYQSQQPSQQAYQQQIPQQSYQQGPSPVYQQMPSQYEQNAQPGYQSYPQQGIQPTFQSTARFDLQPTVTESAPRQAFWREPNNQRMNVETPQSQAPNQHTQRQTSPFQPAQRQIPQSVSSTDRNDDSMNARFTSVVTLNDRSGQDPSRDKVRSIVQLNNVDSSAPTVRGFKLPQEPQEPQQPQEVARTYPNAKIAPWRTTDGAPTTEQNTSAAPMSSRLVQAAVQQPPQPPQVFQDPPARISPPRRGRKSPSPMKQDHRISPPRTMMSSTPDAPQFGAAATPPAPPPPPPTASSAAMGPPPPPPPPGVPPVRRTSTGKIIKSSQNVPELDARSELMMAIRNFGGSDTLRRRNES